ncbi:unnamed protein product [Closterium sp. NIES-54]
MHSDRGVEFSSNLLRDFCRGEGIHQSFTLPDSPQQNGIAECRIGLVMEVARTSMIHAAAPHFLWPVAGPAPLGVSQVDPLPGTAPVQVAVVSGAAPGAASGGAGSEGAGSGGAKPEGSEGAESRGAEPRGAASSRGPAGASPLLSSQQLREWLVQRAHRRRGARGAGEPGDAGAQDPTEPGAAGAGGAGAGVAGVGGPCAGGAGAAGAGAVDPGAGVAGGTVRPRPYFVPLLQKVLGVPSSTGLPPPFLCPPPDQLQPPLQPASPVPVPSRYTEQPGGLIEHCEPASCPVSPVRPARRAPRSRPPSVPGTHTMALRPSSVPLHVPLPTPPESSLPDVPDPESDRARAAGPTVARLLATAATDPSFESAAASALVAELLDFAAACRLDYASALVTESLPAGPPSVGGGVCVGSRAVGGGSWTVLKELHAPTSVVATLMLERELSALRLSEGEPVQPVLDKMRDLYAKLATAGITYPEQTKCLKMLSLLPESWLQFTSGLSLPQNQSLWTLEWVRTKILEEDFRRRQLRGGDDGSSGYGMQGSRRGRGRGFGGAGSNAKKDDDSNDQQGGTGWGRGAKSGRGGKSGAGGKMKGSCWYCEKEGHPWFLCYKKPDGWTPQNRHQDGGVRRNQKNGVNMVADSSDNNPKSNGGAEKKKERTAGQFFHIGEQGEQGDASAKVGAELHPLDYWVLDTGATWTMTPRKELLDDVRAAPINEVCSASGHALKVAGAGRAAFKGADGKPVVLHDVLLVPDLKANLISLRKLAKTGVSTSTDGARTYKGQLRNWVLWDLHESKDVYRSMWQLPALAWHGGGQAGGGSASQGECNAVGGVGVKVSARSVETDWATAHRRLGHVAMPLLKQLEKDGAFKGLKLNGQPPDDNCEICLLSKFTRFLFIA